MNSLLRRTAIIDESKNPNITEIRDEERQKFNRADIRYWLQAEYWGQGDGSDDDCLWAALNVMARREMDITAADADLILDLAPGTTLFFNHSGTVPAAAIVDEIERKRYATQA